MTSSFTHLFNVVVLGTLLFGQVQPVHGEVVVKSGDQIAFMGDQITWQGVPQGGFMNLVMAGLKTSGVDAEAINAAREDDTSREMLARYGADVIAKKPAWLVLSCGMDDVWHGDHGVTLDDYKKNITEMVEKAQGAGIKVMILTTSMVTEDVKGEVNQKLIPYNDFLRQLAKDKGLPLADANAALQTTLSEERAKFPALPPDTNLITGDGFHLNPVGSQVFAKVILTAFGLTPAQIAAGEKEWLSAPITYRAYVKFPMTIQQFEALQAKACAAGKSPEDYIASLVTPTLSP